MSKEELLLKKIEEVRSLMNQLVSEKSELIDPELVKLSQRLDILLNEYNSFIRKDNKKL
ncbi:aspartyl-phosphate phosphatase Spo0E family protein [Clostridium sp. MB40-C1]|uniref:aspartyl-phosphate phosphatase Spo0E family protein n=1 Tax=Clostridium sp. MB40-C1 TaxID=3070996 RepID=UPI0027E0FBC9|nr:aspartyl-phosphate phosphatase Spo0E family protein [Clostridium sp. MB40-C1]WMJ82040.1 aspartyl-phosphate phosphatase Spo0E family protein [Clostridium sp. MB40-C1]